MTHQIMFNLPVAVIGSDELHRAVRASFVARGTSLSAWCKANGVNRQTAEKTLRGERGGRKAVDLRGRIYAAAFPVAEAS